MISINIKLFTAMKISHVYFLMSLSLTGGWRKSLFFLDDFVPRFPWVGVFSGSPWHCLWCCVWLSVFLHSSVTTTTDVRTRKQSSDFVRGENEDLWTKCSRTTKEQNNRDVSRPLSLSVYHITTLESIMTRTLKGQRLFERLHGGCCLHD